MGRQGAPLAPARFEKSFTAQAPLPEASLAAADRVLRSGALHRYGAEPSEAAALEREFAAWQGAAHCLAVASGGQAMQIALRAAGVAPGDRVLTNAFTLAPVPGAIAAVGAQAVLVEIGEDLRIDAGDLAAKAPGAKALMLSHMRGHLPDMDRMAAICAERDVILIEDCAHTMGAEWRGVRSGNLGLAGCFSTQTYKHLNSGEGGLLTSSDPEFMARAILLSGSYMLHDRHGAPPPASAFEDARWDMPNTSARMDELRAAILRPQLAGLNAACARWRALHGAMTAAMEGAPGVALPRRPDCETPVGSSFQFRVPGLAPKGCRALMESAGARGVVLKWFGAAEPEGFTSAHASWRYVPAQSLPRTDAVLASLFDLRLPLTFEEGDARAIAAIVRDCLPA